jgi:hypothetical protein
MDFNIIISRSFADAGSSLKSPLSPRLKDKYCCGYGNIHGVYFSMHGNYNILGCLVEPLLG